VINEALTTKPFPRRGPTPKEEENKEEKKEK
jgi:hypothetical protein